LYQNISERANILPPKDYENIFLKEKNKENNALDFDTCDRKWRRWAANKLIAQSTHFV